MSNSLIKPLQNGARIALSSPTAMPRAAGFLWNKKMMIQVNCRGYAIAQFMQPEPAKYTYAPNLEAKTFMQPEQPYYAHHPGRFVYIKDEDSGELFSAPYEPVRAEFDHFEFCVGKSDIQWTLEHQQIRVILTLSLPTDVAVECWQLQIINLSQKPRKISVYPYMPIGYMSWMNQSAHYDKTLGGIIAACVTPYQKVADHFKNKYFKDLTFFLHDRTPDAYETSREAFEGEGGLHDPSAIHQKTLANGDALYETPAAVLQYRLTLKPQQKEAFKFLLGPAFDHQEIAQIKARFFADDQFKNTQADYAHYVAQAEGALRIETPDAHLDTFINHWLPRQVFYHGDVNRLTTDPQTRNYLQDNMGMTYIKPQVARAAFLHALSQQEHNGAMPDGILLMEGAELKFINQIPHTDHCVWLPVCLRAYLDETNDYAILDEPVKAWQGQTIATAFERISNAMRWLLCARDERGLSFIAQGDWCDPMNMVGYKGKGVSGWLTVATAYALHLWADICEQMEKSELAHEFRLGADDVNKAANQYLWDGDWYARGITDDNITFGISKDTEGRIFLNPQSWAILGRSANAEQQHKMMAAVEAQLETPYGVMMLAPAYTKMRDDVGRVTQKFPGSAENGSVYNHAAAFYIYSLYTLGKNDRAYRLLRNMIAGPDLGDLLQRGQMPVYIPNYYRGAYYQHPRTAGRSSQLFNTGTVSWVYRTLIEHTFGLKGGAQGLWVKPQLPSHWPQAKATREFRGAHFNVTYERTAHLQKTEVYLDTQKLDQPLIQSIKAGATYQVKVLLPFLEKSL